jgi:very-short-patch-repair endonuclease
MGTEAVTSAVPTLIAHCKAVGLPEPETEVRFHPVRRWRADLLWREPRRLIVEVNGGGWVGGRHNTGAGSEKDYEKIAHAMIEGFPVLQVTPRQVKSGDAVKWIEALLKGE